MYDIAKEYLFLRKEKIPEAVDLLYSKIIAVSSRKIKTCNISEDGDFYKFYYNDKYLKGLTLHDASMCVLHELYHVLLGHLSEDFHKFLYNFGYTPRIINKGLDMEVNGILGDLFQVPNRFILPSTKHNLKVFTWKESSYDIHWVKFGKGIFSLKTFTFKKILKKINISSDKFILILDTNSMRDPKGDSAREYIQSIFKNKEGTYSIYTTGNFLHFGQWSLSTRIYAKDRFMYVFTR